MAMKAKVKGLDRINRNAENFEKRFAAGLEAGKIRAGLHLQAASIKQAPEEFGPLRESSFVNVTGSGVNTKVRVGYRAEYAGYVHEKVDMKLKGKPRPSGIGTYWSPRGAKAKFLEDPVQEEKETMTELIAIEIRKAVGITRK